jgi:hypothetical protein
MKRIINRIINFYERNESVIGSIFLIFIPFIVAIVGGTLGYVDKGFLGALAGFIRFGFYYYLGCFVVYMIISTLYEYWELILAGLFFCYLLQ